MSMRETISFTIQNNRNAVIPVSLLGNNADAMDNANATTEYGWDITGFTPSTENTLSLQYRGVNQVSFSTVQVPLQASNLQGVINTLNSLNLGIFFINQVGGNTYINNYNQHLVFGTLDVFDNTIPPTGSLQYQNLTTILTQSLYICFNGSLCYNSFSGYTDSASFTQPAGTCTCFTYSGLYAHWTCNSVYQGSFNSITGLSFTINCGDVHGVTWQDNP